jgi:CubicO group peptidase (beta-lactamase class C family)
MRTRRTAPAARRRRTPAVVAGILVIAAAGGGWFLGDPRLGGVAEGLDRDASGRLEVDEVGPVARRVFAAIDRDGSGALDGVEFRRWVLGRWLRGGTRTLAVPPAPATVDAAALRAWIEAPVAAGALDGAGLLVLKDGEVVFRATAGRIEADAAEPLASSSQWLTGATFACLADRGQVDLDAPLGTQLPAVPAPWRTATPAQLLSHTAGAPAEQALGVDPETSVALAGRRLAEAFPPASPGTVFRYGGVSVQVAGWLAEAATGKGWRRLFVECLAWPLSLDSAAWGHPLAGPARSGLAHLGSGAWLSLDDYGAFLSMLQQDGRYGGVANLDPGALAAVARDRTAGLPREELPPVAEPDWGYGLGVWCEVVDAAGRCLRMNGIGAFGALPWLDARTGVAGLVLVVDRLPRVRDWVLATRELAERFAQGADSEMSPTEGPPAEASPPTR